MSARDEFAKSMPKHQDTALRTVNQLVEAEPLTVPRQATDWGYVASQTKTTWLPRDIIDSQMWRFHNSDPCAAG